MASSDHRTVPGLVPEASDQEILVSDTDHAAVDRVSGPAAAVLRRVLDAGGAPIALEDDGITTGLVNAGVLVPAVAPADAVGRRSFVGAAAAVGTTGIITLVLPGAAAAASPGGGDGDVAAATPTPSFTGSSYKGSQPGVVGVTWEQNITGAFEFIVTITRTRLSGGTVVEDLLLTSVRLASDVEYFLQPPSWLSGETIRIDYATVDLTPTVNGLSRFVTRD